MNPVHINNGGHSVHGGIAFPLERDCSVCRGQCPVPAECQLPIAAPDRAGVWSVAQAWLLAVAVACGIAAGVGLFF